MNNEEDKSSEDSSEDWTDEEIEAYNRFVDAVSLDDIKLRSVDAELEELDSGASEGLRLIGPKFKWQIPEHGDNNVLVAFVRYELESCPNPDETSACLRIVGEYVIVYSLPMDRETPSAKIAETFSARNAVFNSWPYFRELAQSLGSRMDEQKIIMPLYRLPKKLS
jgi:hypothetical protein